MPYVDCPRCGLTSFTAAYHHSLDDCARCGSELPRPARFEPPKSPQPRLTRKIPPPAIDTRRYGKS
jgi:hypothetical protein